MCSRFSFKVTEEELRNLFADPRIKGMRVERIDYVSPGEWIVIIRPEEGERVAELANWTFIPSSYKDPKQGHTPTCIRGETIDTSPMFRKAFLKSRCIIPMRGFFEFLEVHGMKRKMPIFFPSSDGEVMGVAGLHSFFQWPEGWTPKPYKKNEIKKPEYIVDLDRTKALMTTGLVTIEPNDIVKEVHDRMPVILPRHAWDEWLDPKNEDREGLKKLIRTAPNDIIIAVQEEPRPPEPRPSSKSLVDPNQPSLFGED